MPLHVAIDRHQAERHQRVVGDDAVAAHAIVPCLLAEVHLVPARVERADPTVARPDLPGRELLDRGTEGVAEGDAMQESEAVRLGSTHCSLVLA
jgi:hypothetical protein